jgi:small subunit ribosomal protein S17
MPSKKKETEEIETEATSEAVETSEETSTTATEEKPKKARKAKADAGEGTSVVDSVIETVASAVGSVADAVSGVASTITNAVGLTGNAETKKIGGNRAQRIGVVTSDKMTKTVTVRVDRLIKHPKYRRYVRRKKQFMAHDELGATIGDKVRIIETRPLSARKRWRVIEIVQKAAK